MCDPASAAATAAVIGTVVQTVSTIRKSNAASAESDFRSQIASNNAQIAENNAQAALDKGEADIADKRRETNQQIGQQRAALAGMGFDVFEGSSVDILADTAVLGELDALRIDADAQNRANNFRAQAGNFQTESQLNSLAAKNQKSAGRLDAASTLITGGANATTTFLTLKP